MCHELSSKRRWVLAACSACIVWITCLIPQPAHAATATVRPNGDVTTEWNTGGSSDSTCSGSHCSRLDETSPSTIDFVRTDILLGNTKTELFEMSTTDVGQGATQIKIRTHARSGLALPALDAVDQIVVSLWIGGGYITGTPRITPGFPAWNWFETTFTGTWGQSDIDAMRVRYVNDIQGLGLVQNDLQIAATEAEITYTPDPTVSQAAYRIYQNADNATPGSSLASTNTSAELPGDGAAFRLRMGLDVGVTSLNTNFQQYKLQYAQMSGSCDTGFSGESYSDITTNSGALRWYNNPSVADGATIASYANDPTTSGSKTHQTYRESSPFSNPSSTASGNTALWDFALYDAAATPGTSYCLRIVKNNGSLLDLYSTIPQVTAVGDLTATIVDGSSAVVSEPLVTFGELATLHSCQTATATLGATSQKLRLTNDIAQNGWSASIAPTGGPTAQWQHGSNGYDFNDTTSNGCSDGADADALAGRLTVDPSNATVTPEVGCSTTGITKGGSSSFAQGATDTLALVSASSAAPRFCDWDITGIGLSQTVPAGQTEGSYSLDLTITIVAQ